MTAPHTQCQPGCVDLARRAAMFQEGTRRLYEDEGATKGDLWFFELWHFLGDVTKQLESSAAVAQDAVNVLVAGSNPASPATTSMPLEGRGGAT